MAAVVRRMGPVWWGLTPALDLQMHLHPPPPPEIYCSCSDDLPELNILLVGGGDGRHILKTICQASRWPHRKLKFFIIESDLELLARHMLFLSLALEHPEQMGLQEKSELFLELFGNSLIRNKTASYLQEKSELFIRYVTDPDYQQSNVPLLNLSSIKFKERDKLEDIFKFWRNADPKLFPIDKYWDEKNRQNLGRRYDSRKGAYDWDLSMKLHDRGAGVINSREYNYWREKGVAFMNREGVYDIPNKTLASQMVVPQSSGKVLARGYWGDITASPYIAFGIETEEESLLQTANGVHVKSAQDIAQHNMISLFHELAYGKIYSVPASGQAESELAKTDSDYKTNEEQTVGLITLNNVEIHFLPRFNNFFNLLYFSCSMVHFLKPEYKFIAASKATLVLELTKFMVDLQTEKLQDYVTIVAKLAQEAGFTPTETIDWKTDYIAKFERAHDS
uniref:Dynein axonemal assembly factor 3 n=1 Tax=Xenopus tropicalis TaxID=8364 RepID=DAAF3_XENTR|nr:RecName: Full=Dynein axonemal assembly factor 3 [Xenopus tropicalis]